MQALGQLRSWPIRTHGESCGLCQRARSRRSPPPRDEPGGARSNAGAAASYGERKILMPAGSQSPQDVASPANGHSTAHELFALTDEQILEIEPDSAPVEQPLLAVPTPRAGAAKTDPAAAPNSATPQSEPENKGHAAQAGVPVLPEPPPWLAAQMKDPWTGEEARELWNGVQQAKSEAAAYRAAFANPEDARALKELYPGGVNEARAAAERARTLDDIDR